MHRRAALATLTAPILHASSEGMFANAQAYERFMGRWSNKLAPLLVKFAAPAAGHWLDVGSGAGALAFAAAKNAQCRVTGIDPSKEYIDYAKSRNSFGERVRFETGDAQQLRFGAATFQAALSLLVFNFIPDRAKALSEVRRVTEPGGCISAAVWDYAGGMEMLRIFWDAAVAADPTAQQFDEAHMPLCRPGELGDLWKQGGLERVEEHPLEIGMKFRNLADYWEPFLLGQGPAGAYVRRLDEAGREAVKRQVRRRMGSRAESAAFELKARAWAVRGFLPRHG